jgi:hypothetical protein
MGDVDPTGDRTWRGDNQPKVYFADLRHEVELAARRHAELSEHADEIIAERDRLRAVVEDAAYVLGAEEMDYDQWCGLLGRVQAALGVSPEATDG